MATDPVCGMQVDEKTAAGSSEFEGGKVYFCSAGCMKKFGANPSAYVGTPATGGTKQTEHSHPHAQTKRESPSCAHEKPVVPGAVPPGTTYTCPMHPEIVRDAPGDCPICGMALVPIAGMGAAPPDDSELRDLARRLWIGVALSIPLVVLAMSPMIGIHDLFGLQPRPRGWVEFVLGTPVVLWVGWPILRKFWFSLVHRALNMYTLIGLGVGLAYLFSLAAVFLPGLFPQEFREHDGAVGTYFEAAAVIVTLVILGDFLQLRASSYDWGAPTNPIMTYHLVSTGRADMNTSHGDAVLPNSRRQAAAIAALKQVCTLAVLIALGLTSGMARAGAVNPDQPMGLDGMELFFGLIPAEILRGHPSEHEERSMHGGVPRGKGVHHLIISLFDAKTRKRITDAVVTGSVTEVGLATQNRKLEAMSFGGNVAYGNYFAMSNQGPYEIVIKVRRLGDRKTATARFQYWHPRR